MKFWPFNYDRHQRYGILRADLIQKTIVRLRDRISERFPGSGLWNVSYELERIGEQTERIVHSLSRPYWLLRILALLAVLLTGWVIVRIVGLSLQLETGADGVLEWIQAIEAAINELVFLAIGLYFLFTIEMRIKRRLALRALHRLRSIAHVIDMHQLTKDPAYVLAGAEPTASSPERTMQPFELVRYLDYCTELLSLTSKLASLYIQHLNDAVVLEAVNDLESLADGLSGKIWQKIMILDLAVPNEEE